MCSSVLIIPRSVLTDDAIGRTTYRKKREMALFMDVHQMGAAVSLDDVAKAHQADLATQGKHGVDYRSYWVDEAGGKIFCLVDAPDAETAARVHLEAHGLVADEIHAVSEGA